MAKQNTISSQNVGGVAIAAPPANEDLLAQIAKLQEELGEKNVVISQQDDKIHALEYSVSSSLTAFENKLVEEQNELADKYVSKIREFPIYRKEVERDHKGHVGQTLRKTVLDKDKWDQDQRDIFEAYEIGVKRLDDMRKSTLIAITLIDDPDVADGQLNCGVNGQMLGVYYSNDYMVEGAKEGRRVQLIPYTHYLAIARSYKVRFKPFINATGGEGQLPYKLSPVVEASIATESQIAEHKQKMAGKNLRRNMEFTG